MRGILLAVMVLLLVAAQTAAAPIGYTSQIRAVNAIAGPSGGLGLSDQKSTNSLGPWADTATITYSNPPGSGTGTANQISDLASQQISMSGDLSATTTAGYVGNAQSQLGVSFLLASPSPYVSALSISGDASTKTFGFQLAGGSQVFAANSSGILPAGGYSLTINFSLTANELGQSLAGGYSYRLDVAPEPSAICLLLVGGVLVAATRGFRR